ncbi:halocin C8-like domain-containing protein [Haloferax larsenii]|uniref:Halocin C8-like bacteriocin domain-containing protein n=1 Tax=Haloferax larsenii TaxID=302484 RepID=A0A1H7T849_HALLR|nr:halocin C8-like domain-containing protein [Haloferax larsenii]SEL80679.1 halocin C8-like bacteriocin domain-containing protein [Haloferax larsenii]
MTDKKPNRRKVLKGMAALGSVGIGSTLNVSVAAAKGDNPDPVTIHDGKKKKKIAQAIAKTDEFKQLRKKAKELGYSFSWGKSELTVGSVDAEDFKREVASYELQDAEENTRAGIILGRDSESHEIVVAELDVEHYHEDGVFKKLERYDLLGDDSAATKSAVASSTAEEADDPFTKTTSKPNEKAVRTLIDDLSKAQSSRGISTQDVSTQVNYPDLPDELNISSCSGCYYASKLICRNVCGAFGGFLCGLLGISVVGAVGCVTFVKAVCYIAEKASGCGDDLAATICKSSGLDVCGPNESGDIIDVDIPYI